MALCAKCNTSNPDESRFCKECGQMMATTGTNRCPKGHVMDSSWSECPQCKAEEETVQRPATVLEPPPSPVSKQRTSQSARRKTEVEDPPSPSFASARKRRMTRVAPDGDMDPSFADSPMNRLSGFLVTFSMTPTGQFFEIREGKYNIGSGAEMEIRAPEDATMSSFHATLLCRKGKFLFRDNFSTNSSFVNGEEAIGDTQLANHDTISMGETEFKLIMIDPS